MNAKAITAGIISNAAIIVLACTMPPAVVVLFAAVFTISAICDK